MQIEFKPYPFAANRYGAALPETRGGVETVRHPVVIVGGGPVGLTAALGLAQYGVPVVLIEADDSVCFGSRAICISRRSLQIMQRLGALDGFLSIGLPWTGGRSFYRDVEVLNFRMPQDENQKLPPMVNLAQYHIEQILLERAEAMSGLIDIRWQSRVTALDAHGDGVRLSVATPLGDYAIDTDWLVAADGGRSVVRESLGLALKGTSYEGRYVVVDILMKSDRATERLAYFDPPCNPGSTVLVHKQPDDVWRIDYQLRDDEDPDEAVLPEHVMPRVASLLEMMGERAPWHPVWTTIYRANALTLERYRHGRVLLAGDAAHLVPIFGVRGANSGIDDADNLAWKLAFVVKGLAGERLLDSYSDERVAAAHENLRHGTKSTEFMAPPSFAFERMRTAVLGLAARHEGLRTLINPRQTSAIRYDASPLNALPARSAAFDAGPVPGEVLPECPVTIVGDPASTQGAPRAGHLTEVLGARFTALLFCEEPSVPAPLQALAHALDAREVPFALVPVVAMRASVAPVMRARGSSDLHVLDATGRAVALFGAQPGSLYLVRPDGYVLARWIGLCPDGRRVDAAQLDELRGAIDAVLAPPDGSGTTGAPGASDASVVHDATAAPPVDLDTVYTALCKTMTTLGEDGATRFLERFALLAIDRLRDGAAALELIDAAREGLAPPTA